MAENSEKSSWQKMKDKIRSGTLKATVVAAAMFGNTPANAAPAAPQTEGKKAEISAPVPAQSTENARTASYQEALQNLSEKENSSERSQKKDRINSIIQAAQEKKKQNTNGNSNISQDEAHIELTDKKGRLRESENIQINRSFDDYDIENGNGYVSTTVTTERTELDGKGRTEKEHTSVHNTTERLSSTGRNQTTEQGYTHSDEYDRKGNLRHSEHHSYKETTINSGVAEREAGYNEDFRFSEERTSETNYDRNGRAREETISTERGGSYPFISDNYTQSRRGHDIYEAKDNDMKGIKETVSAMARHNGDIEISSETYKRNGDVRKSVSASIQGNTETYSYEKDGFFRDRDISITVDKDGNVSGSQQTTNIFGKTKNKELSESKATSHIRKMRNQLDGAVERFGAENIEEYAAQRPQANNQSQAPLGLAFDAPSDHKGLSDEQIKANQQKFDKEKGINATDVLIKNLKNRVLE